ncbi:MAG TPA: hypothetical protein VFO62_00940, partial [Candidatus Binatia bacterium]|nr:hypothetical protein [Candidatus Binatia bacterium]
MTYPQPSADSYVVNGADFFRLNTLLSSPGDIYESPQGGYAFALGPESDISKVNVAYLDEQTATQVNQFSVGPARALTGLVPARNDATYEPTSRPGKLLFWADDLYNPSFTPPGYDDELDILQWVAPRLDIIQYFAPPPGVTPARTDKTWLLQNIQTVPNEDASTYFLFPYYGRRLGNVIITNVGADPFNFGVFGINFSISPAVGGTNQITPIRALAPIAAAAHENTSITAAADGTFD